MLKSSKNKVILQLLKSRKWRKNSICWQITFFIFLTMCLELTGCSSGASDTPPLAQVEGVVTLDGTPLTSGSVQFIPDTSRGTSGRMSIGSIDKEGEFELTTIEPGDGAQIGHHLVTIERYEVIEFDPDNPKEQFPKLLIPKRYIDTKTSKLTAEVTASGENKFKFELISK